MDNWTDKLKEIALWILTIIMIPFGMFFWYAVVGLGIGFLIWIFTSLVDSLK